MVITALIPPFLFHGLPAQLQTVCILLGLSWICQILWSCHRAPSYVYCLCHHLSLRRRLRHVFMVCYEKILHIIPFSLYWSYSQISCCMITTQKYNVIIILVKNIYSLRAVYNFFSMAYRQFTLWPDYLNCPVLLLFPDGMPLVWAGGVHKHAARHKHCYRTVTQICTNKEISLQEGKPEDSAVCEDLTDIFYTPAWLFAYRWSVYFLKTAEDGCCMWRL